MSAHACICGFVVFDNGAYVWDARDFARESEQITLAGPFTHRQPPRHAPRERFERWRLLMLALLYARMPLLCGLRGAL